LISEGETRTSFRWRGWVAVGIERRPECSTGIEDPLPTTIREREGDISESIPELLDMWEDAPVSRYHSLAGGGGA
jgi:hypothetical protein